MNASPQRVLIVCSDLFFSTRLRAEAERAGALVELELQGSHAASRALSGEYAAVVADLESPGLDISRLMEVLPPGDRPKVIAFGPHVQEQRLAAARAAGCDQVVSRGQIASGLCELLKLSGE